MSRRMLKHRYPTEKATEAAQPVAPLPQPAADIMPRWDGAASFQPAQYPTAVLDPQHEQQPQSNSQKSWSSMATTAANGSAAGSAVHYGQGENYWNWNTYQEPAAVAGGDGMMSAPTQSWSSGNWSTSHQEMISVGPQSWTGGGGAQPPDLTGVGDRTNLHEAVVAPMSSGGTYHLPSLYPEASQFVPSQEGQQYGSGGVVTERTGPQEGWVAPSWGGGDASQWQAGLELQQQYGSTQVQWYQEGMPAESWPSADGQWQDSQVGTAHAGKHEGSSLAGYNPSDDSLHCQEQQQEQQQLHSQDPPSTAGQTVVGDASSLTYPSGLAADSQDGFQGTVGSLQQSSHQYVEPTSGDDGTMSMFFQDGSATVGSKEGTAPVEESREGPSTHDVLATPEHAEEQPASLGIQPHEQERAITGMPEDGVAVTLESVNQEVPDSVLRPEPQEALQLHMEGGGTSSEEAACAVAVISGVECGAQCPAPSKKAVIRARQGGPFKPPALVRQGSSTETDYLRVIYQLLWYLWHALMQQNAAQLHITPDNLELLPPDEVARHASLRHHHLYHRQGVAPLSPTTAVGSVGTGLTLLDAPDMQPLVTLAPAAPPIPHDRPASLSGVQSNEVVEQSPSPLTSASAPTATEEMAPPDGHCQAHIPRMVAPPLMRQSPLGREEGTGRGTVAPPPLRVATTLASSPLLLDSTLPERTEPSGSTDGDHPQPAVTATRTGEVKESLVGLRPNATSTPTGHLSPHRDTINVSAVLAHPKHDAKEPDDKGSEPRVRQEEPRKEKQDESRDYRDSRDSRPARNWGNDAESPDWKGSRDDFERDSRRGGRADSRDDQDRKRDRYYDLVDNRRGASKEDRDELRKGGSRSGVGEDWKRRDDYHDDRRGDKKDDQYEDRRGDRHEELRDDYRKSDRRGDRYHDRRDQWRGQESDDEWKDRRSDRRSDRYSTRHDYRYDDHHSDRYSDRGRPSSRTSQDAYLDDYDRRGDRRHRDSHNRPSSRHSESDSSSPESRRGYGTGKHRKYRDADKIASSAYYDQKSYGGAGGAGGYDYNTYRRDYYNYYHYGYAPRSGYGYGYYDELYRTNPAYKQQVDAYYARLGYNPAQIMERLSVHSGRSSANGDSRRDESFASNTEDDCDPSILDNESTRLDHVPQPEEVKKFSRPHPLARFCGANGLLKLVPTLSGGNLPPPIEIHSLKHLFQKDPQFHELQAFPGPLVRSETHKNDVIQFCTQKIQSFAEDPSLPDRSSHILLWELLVLMLRQNGFVSGSDIAELLLRGHDILGPSASTSVLAGQPGGEGGEVTSPEGADDGSSRSPDEGIVVSDRAQLGTTGSSHTLAKFREFLLFGHKKDALEWAVKCGLWGHALSLASKMDARTYASIMTRFTNALAINDPLQTLYQHLSGRQPAAVTCIADEKWGDWRPHLAMILSNPSSRPEVDARSITTLGDVLASCGCLSAAHFCYLMAQVEFGTYACKSSKMVLLGSSHHTLSFVEFASNEAIQCTEIYEYSQSLANAGYMLPHLQVYKFLHATRLAEFGFAQEALHYCEVLAEAMVRQCESAQLAAQTYELASRLKYHDPHFSQGQGELEELGEPLWLSNFAQLLQQLRGNSNMSQVGIHYGQESGYEGHEAQPVSLVPSTESLHGQQGFNSSTGFAVYDSSMPILQQSGKFNNSYLDTSACGDIAQGVSPLAEQWTPLPQATSDFSQHLPPTSMSSFVAAPMSVDSGWNSVSQLSTAAQPSAEYNFVSTSPPLPSESAAVTNGMSPQADGSGPSSPPVSSQPASFDYYKASTYSQAQNLQHRQTSRERLSSVSSSTDTRDRRDSVDSAAVASGRSQLPSGPQSSLATDQSASESERSKPVAANKGKTQVAGKSWLGGIFGKLLPKSPNQMILPDDKDPDIVWDEQKKCWVDKNAAPGEVESRMAAPPLDTSFGGKPSPLSSKPGENRFQLSKQRSLRKHYVDVLNPNSNKASSDSPSAPVVAAFPEQSAAQPPVQFFVPPAVGEHDGSSGYEFVSPAPLPEQTAPAPPPPPETVPAYQPSAKAVSTPMMFDPADFSSRAVDSSHKAAGGNLARRRAYPT
ncbi:protein transport protein sec-16A.1-like isoform X3 [Dermacentor albipictus]|uniref:protein transport protein sec-16A.1-like isoform X3 n=1 Tax=Dermacentor albipictus TaxID=60249 RepID=UPI0038FC1B03